MKFILIFVLVIIIVSLFSSCSSDEIVDSQQNTSTVQATINSDDIITELSTEIIFDTELIESDSSVDTIEIISDIQTITEHNSVDTIAEMEETQQNMITLTIGDNQAVVKMFDNEAAKNFMDMLPLTLTFEDYNGIEKISVLSDELILGDAPTSCDPDIGTFAYYVPWGNLSIFYNDFRQSESLVPLGIFESGIEFFSEMNEDFTITIERK